MNPKSWRFTGVSLVLLCGLGILLTESCSLESRLKAGHLLKNIKTIREGERQYFNANGRFASLEELAQSELVSDELRDGEDEGYVYALNVYGPSYRLIADPVPDNSGQMQENRFFMDETGVIRASDDPSRPASKYDVPIK